MKIHDNLKLTEEEIELYTHRIPLLADRYIQYMGITDIKELNFNDMIMSISDNIKDLVDLDRPYTLDTCFDEYIKLCLKYNRNPSIGIFYLFIGVDSNTMNMCMNDNSRVSSSIKLLHKKWIDICRSMLTDDLHNSKTTNANKIFVAKASYGMTETQPTNDHAPGRYITADTLPVLSQKSGQTEILLDVNNE